MSKEPQTYEVVLLDPGPDLSAMCVAMCEILDECGWGDWDPRIEESTVTDSGCPFGVVLGVDLEEAEKIKTYIEQAGATIEIKAIPDDFYSESPI